MLKGKGAKPNPPLKNAYPWNRPGEGPLRLSSRALAVVNQVRAEAGMPPLRGKNVDPDGMYWWFEVSA